MHSSSQEERISLLVRSSRAYSSFSLLIRRKQAGTVQSRTCTMLQSQLRLCAVHQVLLRPACTHATARLRVVARQAGSRARAAGRQAQPGSLAGDGWVQRLQRAQLRQLVQERHNLHMAQMNAGSGSQKSAVGGQGGSKAAVWVVQGGHNLCQERERVW